MLHSYATLYFGGLAVRLAILKIQSDMQKKKEQDEEGEKQTILTGGNGFTDKNAKAGGLFSGGSDGMLSASGYYSLPNGLYGYDGRDPISALHAIGNDEQEYNPFTGRFAYKGTKYEGSGEGTGADGQAGVGGGVTGENSGFSGLNKALGVGFSLGMIAGPLAPIGTALTVMGVPNPFGYGLKDLAKDVAKAVGIGTDPDVSDLGGLGVPGSPGFSPGDMSGFGMSPQSPGFGDPGFSPGSMSGFSMNDATPGFGDPGFSPGNMSGFSVDGNDGSNSGGLGGMGAMGGESGFGGDNSPGSDPGPGGMGTGTGEGAMGGEGGFGGDGSGGSGGSGDGSSSGGGVGGGP